MERRSRFLSREAPPREGESVTGRKRKPECSEASAAASAPRLPRCHQSAVGENQDHPSHNNSSSGRGGLYVRRSLSNQLQRAETDPNGEGSTETRVNDSSSQGDDSVLKSSVFQLQPHPSFEGIIDTPGGRFLITPSYSQNFATLSQEQGEMSADAIGAHGRGKMEIELPPTVQDGVCAQASNNTVPMQQGERLTVSDVEDDAEFWNEVIATEATGVSTRTPSRSGHENVAQGQGGALVSQSPSGPLQTASPTSGLTQNLCPSGVTMRQLPVRFRDCIDSAADEYRKEASQGTNRNEADGITEDDEDDSAFWDAVIANEAATKTPSKSATDSQVDGNVSLLSQSPSRPSVPTTPSVASRTPTSQGSTHSDDCTNTNERTAVSKTQHRDDAHRTGAKNDVWELARRDIWEKIEASSSESITGLSQEDDSWSTLFQRVLQVLGISITDNRNEETMLTYAGEVCKRSICGAGVRCCWRDNQTAFSFVLSCVTVPALSTGGVTVVIIPDEDNRNVIKMVRMANERLNNGTLGIETEPLICSGQSADITTIGGIAVKSGEKILCKLVHAKMGKECTQTTTMPRIFISNLNNLSQPKMRVQLERLILKVGGISRFVVVEGLVEKSKHEAYSEPSFQSQLLDLGTFIGPTQSVFRKIPWTLLWSDSNEHGDFKRAFDSLAGVLNISNAFVAPPLPGNEATGECSDDSLGEMIEEYCAEIDDMDQHPHEEDLLDLYLSADQTRPPGLAPSLTSLEHPLERPPETRPVPSPVLKAKRFGLNVPQILAEMPSTRLPFLIQFELWRLHNPYKGGARLCENQLRELLTDEFVTEAVNGPNMYSCLEQIHKLAQSGSAYDSCIPQQPGDMPVDQGVVSQLKFSADLESTGRLVLLPPEPIHFEDKRIYRKFGSHRFLHVTVQKNVSEYLMRRLCTDQDGRILSIAGREYGLLHCKIIEKTQTYILFAERGIGITADEEMTASEAEDWAIPSRCNPDLTLGQKMKRLNLYFSTTTAACVLPDRSLKEIPDILSHGGCVMSDGCGLVSRTAIDLIWAHYCANRKTQKELFTARHCFPMESALLLRDDDIDGVVCPYTSFCGRIGPYKGVWVLETSLEEVEVLCRESQRKFHLPMKSCFQTDIDGEQCYDPIYDTVDVCEWDYDPPPSKLNRRAIQILSFRGISDKYFLDRAEEAIRDSHTAHETHENLLRHHSFRALRASENFDFLEDDLIWRMGCANVPLDEPTFMTVINDFIESETRNMREKARYPIKKSCYLRMIPDHHSILAPGEVFVAKDGNEIHVTKIIAMRSPSYFAEDLLKLNVVNLDTIQERNSGRTQGGSDFFKQLRNGIVLSTQGERSPADMMSGGDFDGDKALVIFDEEVIESVRDISHCYSGAGISSEKAREEQVAAIRTGTQRTFQMLSYCLHFREHSRCLGRLSNALDVAIDTHGFGDARVRQLGIKNFIQVDQPYNEQRLSCEEAKEFERRVPHWSVKETTIASSSFPTELVQHQKITYRSETILGKLHDSLEPRFAINIDWFNNGSRHIGELIQLAIRKAQTDARFKDKYERMKKKAEKAIPTYNWKLRSIINTVEKGEVGRKKMSASFRSLDAEFRRELIEGYESMDDKLLAASLLYQQALLASRKRFLKQAQEEKKKPFKIAWRICHDYLTRIIADGQDRDRGGIGLAPTICRGNEKYVLSAMRRRKGQLNK